MRKILSPYYYLTDVARFFLLFALMIVGDEMVTYLTPPGYSLGDAALKSAGRYALFLVGLFGPFIETLLLQSLPALVGQIYLKRAWQRWGLVVLPFALLHFDSAAPAASLLHGFSGSFILGFMYLRYMGVSHYKAMLMTWLLHAANNLLAVCLD